MVCKQGAERKSFGICEKEKEQISYQLLPLYQHPVQPRGPPGCSAWTSIAISCPTFWGALLPSVKSVMMQTTKSIKRSRMHIEKVIIKTIIIIIEPHTWKTASRQALEFFSLQMKQYIIQKWEEGGKERNRTLSRVTGPFCESWATGNAHIWITKFSNRQKNRIESWPLVSYCP